MVGNDSHRCYSGDTGIPARFRAYVVVDSIVLGMDDNPLSATPLDVRCSWSGQVAALLSRGAPVYVQTSLRKELYER